ncbi:hypothetical protein ABI_33340 [Asticcacaulis biprosthecium C19]|uniref:Uncharacterized protein n=1 Tax=Asticcacaulis biprosthecium C19 TaxID=715226 RepID=F4QQ29_9CAUL|nr:hypothetical protein [Asticcacaulis biprosthecium]EGF90316.1 hypothetical protein ABI_33340 [Asticcacaulis biprosthecium C19]
MTELFRQFWWLIFPAMAMVYGLVQMILRSSYEKKKLDLMRSYLDRGQPVPDALRRDNHF